MDVHWKPPTDKTCPHMGGKPMSEVCPSCAFWVTVRGPCPNTGKELDGYQCAVVANMLMGLEVARLVNQAGAAVESTRNEVVKRMNLGLATLDVGLAALSEKKAKPGLLSYIGGKR